MPFFMGWLSSCGSGSDDSGVRRLVIFEVLGVVSGVGLQLFQDSPGGGQVGFGVELALLLSVSVWMCIATYSDLALLLIVVAGVPGLLAFFGGIPLLRRPLSPRLVACSMIPAIVLVGAFYTLAIHMYLSLGGWPTLIGDSGFSSALKFHAEIAQCCFGGLFLILFVTWPIAVAVFAVVRRWHAGVHYLGMLALAWALGLGLMELGAGSVPVLVGD